MSDNYTTIELSKNELMIINNSLNETMELMSDDSLEYGPRIGATIEEIEKVMNKIHSYFVENVK